MRNQSIAGGRQDVTGLLNFFDQRTLLFFTQISPCILPGIQWTDTVSLLVNINNPMHLSRKSDSFHVRVSVQKIIQQLPAFLYNFLRILNSFPVLHCWKKTAVFNCFCLKNFWLSRICFFQNDTADGRCSNINSYCFHSSFTPIFHKMIFVFPVFYTDQHFQKSSSPALE